MKKLLLTAAAATLTLSLASCDAGLTKEQKAVYDACMDSPVELTKIYYKAAKLLHKDWQDTEHQGSMCRNIAKDVPDFKKLTK